MEKWVIKPLESVGKIKFEMNREEVHNLFNEKCTAFKKTKYSKNTADDYGRFHVFYTEDDKVEAVEIFEGIELMLDGEVLFPLKACDIEKRLPGIEHEGDYYTQVGKSIGIEVEDGDCVSILAGIKGYYE